eukprot:288711_1
MITCATHIYPFVKTMNRSQMIFKKWRELYVTVHRQNWKQIEKGLQGDTDGDNDATTLDDDTEEVPLPQISTILGAHFEIARAKYQRNVLYKRKRHKITTDCISRRIVFK